MRDKSEIVKNRSVVQECSAFDPQAVARKLPSHILAGERQIAQPVAANARFQRS